MEKNRNFTQLLNHLFINLLRKNSVELFGEDFDRLDKRNEVTLTNILEEQLDQRELKELKDSFEKEILKTENEAPSSNLWKNRYKFIENIGEGGMGKVSLLEDKLLHRKVASKTITNFSRRKSFPKYRQILLARLEQEASITAILEHPNIIPLYDIQQDEESLHFTMKKVEGKTLTEILQKMKETGSFKENKVLDIFVKIGQAISYAHSKGIIHRDLKPDNIMVGEFGEVYVMDWGLAKKISTENLGFENLEKMNVFEERKDTRGGLGTLGYMPPEQRLDASKVTFSADIFSLGKVLEECYLLTSPYENILSTLNTFKSNKETKRTFHPIIPKDIKAIIEKATAKEPQNRYQKVEEFLAEIEKYQTGKLIVARKYSLFEIGKKWCLRNWKILSILGIILVVSIGTSLLIQWKAEQKKLKNYTFAMERAKNKYQEGLLIENGMPIEMLDRGRRGKAMQKWLEAVTECNKGGSLYPHDPQVHQLKLKMIQEKLIPASYAEKDYQLPEFLIRNLQNFPGFTIKQQERILFQIKEKREELLKKHQSKLNHWITKAKPEEYFTFEWEHSWKEELKQGKLPIKIRQMIETKLKKRNLFTETLSLEDFKVISLDKENWKINSLMEIYLKKKLVDSKPMLQAMLRVKEDWESLGKGEVQDFIFDVSQMKEIEIYQRLKEEFFESNGYMFSKKVKERSAKQEEYYLYIIEILGRLGNLEIAKELYQTLKLKSEIVLKIYPKNKIPSSESNYMSAIAQAIGNLNATNYAEGLNAIRSNMGQGSLFWEETVVANKKIIDGWIEYCNQLILANPKDINAYNERGIARTEKGLLDEAIKDYDMVLSLDPKFVMAYNNRGLAKVDKRLFDEAIEDYTQAILIDPKFVMAYNNRGLVKALNNKFDEAIEDYNQTLFLDPKYAMAYINRGLAKLKKGLFDEAIKDCNQALSLEPNFAMTYDYRGLAKIGKGLFDEGIKDCNQALSLDPKLATAYKNRGYAKLKKGLFDEAIKDYNQALTLDPKFATAYKDRGLAKISKGLFDEAIKDYNQALTLDPKLATAYKDRGLAKMGKGLWDEAIEDFNQALSLEPKFAKAYNYRGFWKLKKGLFDEAIKDCNQALSLDPKLATAYSYRGNAKLKKGLVGEAIKDCNQALSLDPNLSAAYGVRGNAKLENGLFDEAIKDYDKAISLKPNFEMAYSNRGIARAKKGFLDGAISDWKKSLSFRHNPRIAGWLIDLLKQQSIKRYHKQEYLKAIESLQEMKKYLPLGDPILPQVEMKIKTIKEMQQKKK